MWSEWWSGFNKIFLQYSLLIFIFIYIQTCQTDSTLPYGKHEQNARVVVSHNAAWWPTLKFEMFLHYWASGLALTKETRNPVILSRSTVRA